MHETMPTSKRCDPPPKAVTHSVADVAKRYGVGTGTVLAWIASGELKALNVSRSARAKRPLWRISEASLVAFEAARTPNPPASKARRRQRSAEVVQFY